MVKKVKGEVKEVMRRWAYTLTQLKARSVSVLYRGGLFIRRLIGVDGESVHEFGLEFPL